MATTSPSAAATPEGSASSGSDGAVFALVGNPNSGKTSVFNALTGLRRKVGNYPGITVDRVEGTIALPDGRTGRLVDLPGCYSLEPRSEDERLAREVILGENPAVPRPEAVIVVVDAANLERNLFLVTQLLDLEIPLVVALNMMDVARHRGLRVDPASLEASLGVPVVPVVGRSGKNTQALLEALPRATAPGSVWTPAEHDVRDAAGSDAEQRYAYCRQTALAVRGNEGPRGSERSEKIDAVVTHRVLGPILFLGVMALMFMAVFAWAEPFMGWIEEGTGFVQTAVGSALGDGVFRDLLVDGVIAGVGNVIIFLPQICILFLFLALLEDFGYMARAAFLIDRPMRAAGLSGKSFVPLMSSFACAIPGIMSARTIESHRDRFVTILVAPLMSCSARLPVYVLLIGAFIPAGYQSVTMLSMYVLSVVAAIGVAWILRKTMFRGEASSFLLELPPYRLPSLGNVLRTIVGKAWVFVREAGTVILAISILLWFLAYYPQSDEVASEAEQRVAAGEDADVVAEWEAGAQLEQSYAGRIGHAIEPVIEPLGFDWKTGVGLVASFAAREVMVSTLGIIYSVGEADEESEPLRDRMKADRHDDGSPVHTPLTSISLMVFFVLACQCMSTLAVVKRETNSWRWPIFMVVYMTVLAYVASLAVYQGGILLGYGP